jgi:Type III secretion needle MxiH, YscF, SsaG, EprI, PscF, EscF
MNIGGITSALSSISSLLNIASTFLPALQAASALFNMVSQAVSGAVKGGVDQLVKDSGMPKDLGEAVKKLVDQAIGGNKKDTEPATDEAMQKDFGEQMKTLQENMMKQFIKDAKEASESEDGGKSSGKGGWLVALAKAFGKIADAAAKELKAAGEKLNQENPSEMIEYQAKSQEFSQMMNTFTNAIKTIGEANVSTVRKT